MGVPARRMLLPTTYLCHRAPLPGLPCPCHQGSQGPPAECLLRSCAAGLPPSFAALPPAKKEVCLCDHRLLRAGSADERLMD